MKKVVVLLVVSVFMVGLGVSANAETFKGFLANVAFGKQGIDLAGHDLTLYPDTLPVVAMQFEEAVLKTGYGVYILKPSQSSFTEYQFYMLDAKGNDLAKAIVAGTKELHGVYVTIEGAKGMDNVLTVASMTEGGHPIVLTPTSSTSSAYTQGSSQR